MVRTEAVARSRVLLVVNDAGFFLSHRLPIALGARSAGAEVHVATYGDEAARQIEALGFPFHPVPISRRGLGPMAEARAVVALWRLYREVRPDLVHHVTIKPVLYGSIAARAARVPAVVNAVTGLGYVFSASGVKAAALRRLAMTLYRTAFGHPNMRAIFQNPDDRALFLSDGALRQDAAVLIRGSGVDVGEFVPAPEAPGTPVVVFASRMLWHKGVGDFVEAARQLHAAGVAVRCVLVGDADPGNPASVPREQLADWAASGVVEWWGHRGDMPEVFAGCHIVCLPSAYGEGVPKVLIEAAASGRPIVTTDTPGCREIVRPRENGLLVPVREPDRLADAIRELAEAPQLRRAMGARGRAIVEAEFSLEQVVSETMAVYAELLS